MVYNDEKNGCGLNYLYMIVYVNNIQHSKGKDMKKK